MKIVTMDAFVISHGAAVNTLGKTLASANTQIANPMHP